VTEIIIDNNTIFSEQALLQYSYISMTPNYFLGSLLASLQIEIYDSTNHI